VGRFRAARTLVPLRS